MKNRKNILNQICGLLTSIILVLVSVFIVPMTMAKNPCHNRGVNGFISQNTESMHINTNESIQPLIGSKDELFSQRPYYPNESYSFYTSDSNGGYRCQEDFWDLHLAIGKIEWYGLTLIYDYGWNEGNPNGMTFEIKFYEDSGGFPGNIVAVESNITSTAEDTGLIYSGFPMYHWEVKLSTGVSLFDGWVSVQSTYCPDGSWFLWACSPEGNYNALQNDYNLGDNLAFSLEPYWFVPHHDIKIDSIIQPIGGPAGVIAPIINVTNIGNMYEIFQVTVQITSSTLEYYETQNNIFLWPGDSQQIIFPLWTPEAWHNTIENKIIEYAIIATAIVDWDCNQSDNTMAQSFNLTYTNEVHRLFFFGFISNRTEDNTSISFNARHLFYFHNTSDYNRLYAGEKIILSKKHKVGFVGTNIIIGKFDGVVFSFTL